MIMTIKSTTIMAMTSKKLSQILRVTIQLTDLLKKQALI